MYVCDVDIATAKLTSAVATRALNYVNLLSREHGSVSLCRDGQKTKWRLQCKY